MEKHKFLYLLIFTLLTGCACTNSTQSLMNLSVAKKAVQEYYESGQFETDCSKIISEAIHEIDKMKLDDKAAVVFDVDETALSNYSVTKGIGFGYIPKYSDEVQMNGNEEAIPPTKRFYDYLISKNIHVIFLTGRISELAESTKRNLVEKCFEKFDTLIVRAKNDKNHSAAIFKSSERKKLIQNGYKIIACIGDQESDFTGGNTGYKIKLPNYLYLLD